MGECPVCSRDARLVAAEVRVRQLEDALKTLVGGKVARIFEGYPQKTHPGAPCVNLGHIYEDWYAEAVADLQAARAALDHPQETA